ncbi:MAG: hypothetical protein JO181_22630 [Solirubrobacterales bacterium]|nr:hypothetical protein [Solirubrobacterales bacterium]
MDCRSGWRSTIGGFGRLRGLAAALVCTACLSGASAPPAAAVNPIKPVCGIAGLFSGLLGKACSVVQNGGRLADAGKKLLSGHVGGAVKTALGEAGAKTASAATTALGLAAIGTWVLGGAKVALHETAIVLGHTTTPQLRSTWFSATYWRMAGIAAVLTLPFLFAAAVQALMRSDLALLARSALGYLPLSMLAISVAAPVTMLLLAASDQLSAVISSASGNAGAHFLGRASATIGALTLLSGSPFLAVLIGVLLVAGTVTLWLELLMREAAVYVIVLMLPLAFAAFVWPARRIWAMRAIELLVALILSKFAIVAVLSLGGAALTSGLAGGITGWMGGVVLLLMGAFAPWALLRLMPLSELASSAVGPLRGEIRAAERGVERAEGYAGAAEDWAASRSAEMRRDADRTANVGSDGGPGLREAARTTSAAEVPEANAADPAEPYRGDGLPGTEAAPDPGERLQATEVAADPGDGVTAEAAVAASPPGTRDRGAPGGASGKARRPQADHDIQRSRTPRVRDGDGGAMDRSVDDLPAVELNLDEVPFSFSALPRDLRAPEHRDGNHDPGHDGALSGEILGLSGADHDSGAVEPSDDPDPTPPRQQPEEGTL